jgi:hypothetical protein
VNLRRSRLANRNIEFVCANAGNYHNPDVTVIFMCHPFGAGTLEQVFRNLRQDRVSAGAHRNVRIIYRNPMYENVLEQMSWLKFVERIPPRRDWPSNLAQYETSIWRSS